MFADVNNEPTIKSFAATVWDCFLSSLSPSFRVLIPDVQKLVDQSMSRERKSHRQVSGGYVYTKYHPMEEVKKKLSLLVYVVVFCSVNATAGSSVSAESSDEVSGPHSDFLL